MPQENTTQSYQPLTELQPAIFASVTTLPWPNPGSPNCKLPIPGIPPQDGNGTTVRQILGSGKFYHFLPLFYNFYHFLPLFTTPGESGFYHFFTTFHQSGKIEPVCPIRYGMIVGTIRIESGAPRSTFEPGRAS